MKNILLKTKRLIDILTSLLFIFTIILPIINIILLFCFDYVVTVTNFTFYSAMLAIISISLVIFSSRYGTIDYGKIVRIIMSLILPISLLLYSSYLLDIDSVYGYIFTLVGFTETKTLQTLIS